MKLTQANDLAIQLMREHGLIQAGWHFKFDRGTRRFGACKYGLKTISLSKQLTEVNSEDEVRNTITHEIAHALVGHGHAHDAVWQRKHLELGGDGRQCYSADVVPVVQRYKLECPNGHVRYTARRPTGQKACGRCTRVWDERFVYTVTDTHQRQVISRPRPAPTPVFALAQDAEPRKESLKRVDSHEWQTRDGRLRFVRGFGGAGEREWQVVNADGTFFRNEIFPTLNAAKEAAL